MRTPHIGLPNFSLMRFLFINLYTGNAREAIGKILSIIRQAAMRARSKIDPEVTERR